MTRLRAYLAFAAVMLAGCARSDFEKICNAEKMSGVAKDDPNKAQKIAKWIGDNLHSRDGKRWFSAIASTPITAAQKGENLREAAQEAGYDGACPMADDL